MAEKFKHLFASTTGLVFFVFQASEGKHEAGVEREIRGIGEGVEISAMLCATVRLLTEAYPAACSTVDFL